MIISNLEQHTLIDAYSYSLGYGCFREVPLEKVFHDIKTYQELKNAMVNKEELILINRDGEIVRSVPSARLLRL